MLKVSAWREPRRRWRILAACFAFALLATAACGEIADNLDLGDSDANDEVPEANGEAPGDAPPDAEPEPPGNDGGPVGENALVYLRDEVPKLVIEVVAVEGRVPAGSALDHLQAVADRELDKPEGVEVRTRTIGAGRSSYSSGDLRSLEAEHREARTSSGEASVFVLSMDGEFSDNPQALGVAWSASAFAIFPDQIERASTLLVSSEQVEGAVLVHEFGHLLRLVNIGYASPREREDPERPSHSTNPDSVMYWAVARDIIVQLFEGPPPDDFDDDDRADLADLRAGRL